MGHHLCRDWWRFCRCH